VQKEVIGTTLAADYGVDVTFRETTTICIERPAGTGTAVELIKVDPNPYPSSEGLDAYPGPTRGRPNILICEEPGYNRVCRPSFSSRAREGRLGCGVGWLDISSTPVAQ
jgi:hypothetical protein